MRARPDDRGILMMDAEQLFEHARLAAENGLSMAVHAIGDRANHEVLDAYQQLRAYERDHLASPGLRHRIEHVQLIHPDDAGRLAALGVIASMQPIHATSDMLMADRYWGERAALSYAWRTQLQAGRLPGFRLGCAGGIAQPLPGAACRGHPPAGGRLAGRAGLVPGAAPEPDGSAARLHHAARPTPRAWKTAWAGWPPATWRT